MFLRSFLATALCAAPAAAQSEFALRFYGTGTDQQDRVRVRIDDDAPGPDASAPCDVGAGSFTIELWLRGELGDNATANQGGDVETQGINWIDGNIVLDRDIWRGSERKFGISLAGGLVRFGTSRGDGPTGDVDNVIEGSELVLDGSWHHVACVRDAATGTKYLYVDGVLDFQSSPGVSAADISYPDDGAPGQLTPWGPFIVLAAEKHDAGPAYPSFAGYLDELRIWSVARTQAEIAADRNRRVPPSSPGLVADYRLEEGAGTSAGDSSAGGSPAGLVIAGVPGNGEWVSRASDPDNTAPIQDDNLAPVAVADASPRQGPEPLSVQLTGAGSYDPDRGPAPLAYAWDFGDGEGSSEPDPRHVYASRGAYVATLTVDDGDAADQAAVEILVGNPPAAQIDSPAPGAVFQAGAPIVFFGSATDAEDGPLPGNALEWTVARVYPDGEEVVLGPLAGTGGAYTVPTSGYSPEGASYEVRLEARDSDGLPGRASVAVAPAVSELRVATLPAGVAITVDGTPRATPLVLASVAGHEHVLEAPETGTAGRRPVEFHGWSHGRPRTHVLSAPAGGAELVAHYSLTPGATLSAAVAADERNAEHYPPQGQAYADFYDALGLCCGRDGNGAFQMGFEVAIDVPRGATVVSAELVVTATADQSGSPTARVYAYAVADAPPFVAGSSTLLTDHAPLSAASLDWSFPDFNPGAEHASPELRELVQEVVDRPDWSAGSFLGLVLDGSPSASGAWRCVRNFASGQPARLLVTWSAPPGRVHAPLAWPR